MSKQTEKLDPWKFFNLPEADLKLVQVAYAGMLGQDKRHRTNTEMRMMESVLYPHSVQQPYTQPNTYDLHSVEAYHFAKIALIASFIAQYYQPSHSSYRIPLLPEKIVHYFRPPFNQTRDYNRDALLAWRKTLPEPYQRMVFIDA